MHKLLVCFSFLKLSVLALKNVVIGPGNRVINCERYDSTECCKFAVRPEFQGYDESWFPVESHTATEIVPRQVKDRLPGVYSDTSANIKCHDIREGELPDNSPFRELNIRVTINCGRIRKIDFYDDTLKYPLIDPETGAFVWITRRARCIDKRPPKPERDTEHYKRISAYKREWYQEKKQEAAAGLSNARPTAYSREYYLKRKAAANDEEKERRAAMHRIAVKKYKDKKKAEKILGRPETEAERAERERLQDRQDVVFETEAEEEAREVNDPVAIVEEAEDEDLNEEDLEEEMDDLDMDDEDESEDDEMLAESSMTASKRSGTMCEDLITPDVITFLPFDPEVVMAANILAGITAPEEPQRERRVIRNVNWGRGFHHSGFDGGNGKGKGH